MLRKYIKLFLNESEFIMIPKIIHLCWLSGDAFPRDIAVCLESWKQHLNDYEVWLWGKKPKDCLGLKLIEKHFDIESVVWCKQAFEAKKYAFAADYIRLYALYNYGGIYMDSDVIVYKSFEGLLHLPYFIGEDYVHCFEPAIIGAEPHMEWINCVLDRYDGLDFINDDGRYNMRGLPVVFHDRLTTRYKFQKVEMPLRGEEFSEKIINVFPWDYFNSRDYFGVVRTKKSYCSHNYVGSWLKKGTGIKQALKCFAPRPLAKVYYKLCECFAKGNNASTRIPF